MNRFSAFVLLFGFSVCASAGTPNNHTPGLPTLLTDTIPPLITCPADLTISLASGTCDTAFTYTVSAFDDTLAIVPTQWSGLASGETFPIGSILNVFVASDSVGNTADCSFTVTVVADTSALVCRDTVEVYLGEFCLVVPDVSELLLGAYGCPLSLIAEADKEPPFGDGPWGAAFFEDEDLGKTYSYRVADLAGGDACTGAVRVRDLLPPDLACPTVFVPCVSPAEHLDPYFLRDTLGVWDAVPQWSDNCDVDVDLAFVDVRAEYPCDSVGVAGVVTRFWTALDASNNVATCVQTIVRERSVNSVQFPWDGTWGCSPAPLPDVTGWPFVQLADRQYVLGDSSASCGIEINYVDTEQVNCGAGRLINRLWFVSDGCVPDSLDNPAVGEQIVEVVDDGEPILSCPYDTVIVLNGAGCEGAVNLPDLVIGDACSYILSATAYWNLNGVEDSLAAVLSDFAGNDLAKPDTLAVYGEAPDFPVGTTGVLFVATDACGNTASCEINLIVWDSLPPTALCDTFLTAFLDDMGLVSLPAGLFDDGSTDACNPVHFKVRRDMAGACDTLGNPLDDFVRLCCGDLGDTVVIVLRVYDVDVPPGMVPDSLAEGRYTECTAPLLILDINNPQCTAPPDTAVVCENFDSSLAGYGYAEISCVVDSVATLLNYQQFDTVCNRGTITRTFRVFDANGNSGQCSQRIAVANTQNYFVRFPDDMQIMQCDTSGNYGAPVFFGVECENMTATFTETVFFNALDACLRIERTWKVFNGCAHDPAVPLVLVPNPNPSANPLHPDNLPGPVVSAAGTTGDWAPTAIKVAPTDTAATNFSAFWAADANGYTYKQVIRVIDFEAPVFENCPATDLTFVDPSDNDLFLWNDNFSPSPANPSEDLCEGAADLRITVTDACYGARVGVDYQLFLDLDGDGSTETSVNSTDLPLAGTIQYNNINTPGGLTRQYDKRQVASNAKYQFALQADTVGRDLELRLVWSTAAAPGTVLPPQFPLGDHSITWTVYDGCGNETTCAYNFRVEDPDGVCTPTVQKISGLIQTESGAGIGNVAVELNGTHPGLPPFTDYALTDGQGAYSFDVPAGSTYSVTPFRDANPLNGVSTFDLLLINKHVLGLEAIPPPYRMLAADANKSNTVTTFDIVELRKLILGIYQQLPNLPSWRFIPVGHVFSNPANPFAGGFPEKILSDPPPPDLSALNFIGFKVGDINGNANPAFAGNQADDRDSPVLHLDAEDRSMAAGDECTVRFRAEQAVAGMQFTLHFPGLDVLEVLPEAGLAMENFAVFNSENSLTMSWERGGEVAFGLRVRALEAGRLRDMLRLSNRITRCEAYSESLEMRRLALRFGSEEPGVSAGFELFQNQPNPFSETTRIGFYLPQAKTATLRVWDNTGRLLWETTRDFPAGHQAVLVGGLGSGAAVLYYALETDSDRAVRKMVRW